jgi:hypothetical protein
VKEEPLYVYNRAVFEDKILSLATTLTSVDRFFFAIKVSRRHDDITT